MPIVRSADMMAVSRTAMLDKRLSVLARGLLVVMLAHESDDQGLTFPECENPEQEKELRLAIKELERYGYLHPLSGEGERWLYTPLLVVPETPQQVAETAFSRIQEYEKYLGMFSPYSDGQSPREVADGYRQRYASAVEREGK